MISAQINESIGFIKSKCTLKPRIGLILGSGLGNYAKAIKEEWSSDYSLIPNFGSTSVEGHQGKLILGHVGEVPVAALQGRLHLYEGHSMNQVVHATRTLGMLGVQALFISNAAGGIMRKMRQGDFMVIADHLNLMGDNPLRGKNMDQMGPRFPDMTEAYDKSFISLALICAKKSRLRVHSGVYAGLLGPTYETPAEIRYLKTIGADAVGMSTVPEVIAANHFGVRVCGVSCITNMAAGISKVKLSHSDVTVTAKAVEKQFEAFLNLLIPKMAEDLDGIN